MLILYDMQHLEKRKILFWAQVSFYANSGIMAN